MADPSNFLLISAALVHAALIVGFALGRAGLGAIAALEALLFVLQADVRMRLRQPDNAVLDGQRRTHRRWIAVRVGARGHNGLRMAHGAGAEEWRNGERRREHRRGATDQNFLHDLFSRMFMRWMEMH